MESPKPKVEKLLPIRDALSEKEFQVFLGIVEGKALVQIAEEMGLSQNTISTYRTRLMKKLKLNHNAELVLLAHRHGAV
jgi:two-component system invasion response regulator UvrY